MAIKRKLLPGLSAILESIRNSMLPSGAIVWFGNRTTAPSGWAICDGTNGTPNLIGRYPLGSKTNIGQQVAAGLPDIIGTAWAYEIGKANGWNTTGAFYDAGAGGSYGTTGNSDRCANLGFRASKGTVASVSDNGTVTYMTQANSPYGKSTTVTPPSTKLLPCMKL